MTERTFTAAEKMALKDVAAVLLASLGGNGEYLNDLEKSCVRRAATELTAAHERETALRGENGELREQIGELITPDLAELTEQRAITAEAALAEAQREIEKWKAIASENGSSGLTATTLLAAERQKVTALRERVQRRLDKALYSLNEQHNDVDDATAKALDGVLTLIDRLTPAQPPQDAEPAT